ncbi:hypothetical protein [Sinomicrobium oceani]|nr:hypothetical protein [Sinomicrobium oceani]
MKLIFRVFISLSVFLLSGFNPLHAHIDQDDALCATSVSDLDSYEFAGFDLVQDHPDFVVRSASIDLEKRGHETEERNIEEEYNELISLKKYKDGAHTSLTVLFYALIFGNFLYAAQKRLCVPKRFYSFLALTPLYIRFRVFRI